MTPPPLAQALEDFNANDLTSVLRDAGVVDMPKSKRDKIQLWLQMVGDPGRIRLALDRLAPASRRALQMLQHVDGEVRTVRFRSLLVHAGVANPRSESALNPRAPSAGQKTQQQADLPQFARILEDLLRAGLIWTHTLAQGTTTTAKVDFHGGRFVYIPEEVARHLPPPPAAPARVLQVAQTLDGSARTFQRDLYLLWSASGEADLQLTNAGLLRVSDLKRVSGQLLIKETFTTGSKESDFRRLLFLRRLATALEILKPVSHDNGLAAVPSPRFFAQAAPDRVLFCFERWRAGDWWNELWTTYVPGETTASGALSSPAVPTVITARQAVLDAVKLLVRRAEKAQDTTAAWVTLDDISDHLRLGNEEFLVDRATAEQQTHFYGYYYGANSLGVYSPYEYNHLGWRWSRYNKDEDMGWNGVERVFVHAVVTEGLYWLGLVDLGYVEPVTPAGGTAPAGVVALRLTDMGRWLLLGAPPPEIPEERGRVVVQPNFRIFAFDPISDAVLARLDRFASRQNAARAIEYELSRESVYRAQLEGQNAAQIETWLEQTTGAPLPQNVARSLAEWQAAFERITLHSRVGWLEAATPELADVLLHDPRLNQAVIKRVTPTGLIVHAGKVESLEKALLAAGELPARNNDPAAARQRSIAVDEQGHVSFVHPTPSLYTIGYLRLFCEQTAAGWQLTPRSVAGASSAGLDAAAMLGRLEEMAVGGVPAALQVKIKAWSQHFGAATVQTLTLVQFRDQDALNELRRDPQLARYLKPFKPEASLGLAVVAPEHVAAVSALLAERGVEVGSRE